MLKPADTQHDIHTLLKHRWSPFAFAETPVPASNLRRLFEAARWAPSSFNEQPWRFIVGSKSDDAETYGKLLQTLSPNNQAWASTAPVLILGIARTVFTHNGAPNATALYDLGQAVGSLLVQASEMGLVAHQMGGYDKEAARSAFALPEEYALAAVIALGYEGDVSRLSEEKLQARHTNPARLRKPLSEIVLSGAEAFGAASPTLQNDER